MTLKPYNKNTASPYTKTRVILMNGTEFEQCWFLHNFSRHEKNNDLRRELALLRRHEQQQQKVISSLKPVDESPLETTISYEQLAVDLTAVLARHVKDENVKNALNFALLEDFDHLYRFANLLESEQGKSAKDITREYTEIMPGRPTIAEHRHPFDAINNSICNLKSDLFTVLVTNIITAAEQQTMNYYMNIGDLHPTSEGRKLYAEIAMIEEQHVTEYGSLLDTTCGWLENLIMHEYTECYLYHSCALDETDKNMKKYTKGFISRNADILSTPKTFIKLTPEKMQCHSSPTVQTSPNLLCLKAISNISATLSRAPTALPKTRRLRMRS